MYVRIGVTSGCFLNWAKKSEVLGLRAGTGRTSWPLKWLKSEEHLKIFGFHVFHDFKDTIEVNWKDQFSKLRNTIYSWSNRMLDTLFQRAEVLKTFALSRVWFRAQVLPIPQGWAAKFESLIRDFLWAGQPIKNVLSLETVCLSQCQGGLGIPFFVPNVTLYCLDKLYGCCNLKTISPSIESNLIH